jgi:hypothetical protein
MQERGKVKTRTLGNHKGAAPKFVLTLQGSATHPTSVKVASSQLAVRPGVIGEFPLMIFSTVMTLERFFLRGGIIFGRGATFWCMLPSKVCEGCRISSTEFESGSENGTERRGVYD